MTSKQRLISPNKSVESKDKPRISKQCITILGLLRVQDVVTTDQLAEIALQYNARIYELRKAGFDIKLVRPGEGGINGYKLIEAKRIENQGSLFESRPIGEYH